MKKLVFLGLLIAFGSVAHADTIYQVCNIASDNSPFPPTPANLPDSSCQGFDSTPFGAPAAGPAPGDTLNFFALQMEYRIFLEAAAPASVLYGHTVNNIGPISSFNNLVLDPVTGLTTLQWGSGADISSAVGSLVNVFNCAGANAAACGTILTAMNGNSITVTTTFDDVTGPVGEVSATYVWQIDFTPATVPEPAGLTLLGTGLAALAIWRRRIEPRARLRE